MISQLISQLISIWSSLTSQLLERFYEPSSGEIRIDGVPLASLDPSWWRRQLALVAQEPVLFNGTVLDNLRCGSPRRDGH